jgi:hypothetical protein
MRSVRRIFVATKDTGVPAQVELARGAESLGLEGIWVRGSGAGHCDSYATTAAAAIASVTTDLRLGVVLNLAAPDDILRLAEDVAVLDQCSSGRAELWLDRPSVAERHWSATAERFVTNLHTCTVGDRKLAVTPGPLQSSVPVVTRGAQVPVAGAGVVVDVERPQRPADHRTRVVLRAGAEQTRAALAAAGRPDTLRGTIDRLRAAIHTSNAQDLVFVLAEDAAQESVELLASVLAPVLRAIDDEVGDLVLDTLKFRRASRGFRRDATAKELVFLGDGSPG